MILRVLKSKSNLLNSLQGIVLSRNVHDSAVKGFEGGDFYERSRPGYPIEALEFIKDQIIENMSSNDKNIRDPLKILELGSGTGKFSQDFIPLMNDELMKNIQNNQNQVRSQMSNSQCSYGLVEPLESMMMVMEKWSRRNNWLKKKKDEMNDCQKKKKLVKLDFHTCSSEDLLSPPSSSKNQQEVYPNSISCIIAGLCYLRIVIILIFLSVCL